MGEHSSDPLAEAMNRLWIRYLPQIEERVRTLERAADNLTKNALTTAEQERAASDAHKLAGVLGTFGLKEGTELAREAEALYESSLDQSSAAASRLTLIADRLETMVARRNQGTV